MVSICHEAAQTFRKLGASYSEPSFRFEDPFDELELDGDYAKYKMSAYSKEMLPGSLDPISYVYSLPREQQGLATIYIRDRSDRPTGLEYTLSIKPEVRNRARTHIDDFFREHDLLLCPVIGNTAFEMKVNGKNILWFPFPDLAAWKEKPVPSAIPFLGPWGGRLDEEAAFRRRFDLMALQRNLKALGTFGYQTTGRRNPVYIQYMPRTLKYARETLHKYPRFKRFAEILGRHMDELK